MKTSKVATVFLMLACLLACLLGPGSAWTQEQQEQGLGSEEETALTAPEQKVEPVFPEENEALIFIEGEDAVSTNFSNEPILNYGCSKFRTLQLNRITGLQGGRSFYATFVLFVEDAGEYEFWYGGTPPGPEDELLPSYSSPFSYSLDGGDDRSIYREDISVVEQYAPSYYWNYVGDIDLEAGQHRVDFAVSQTRGYDGKYHFYLDCFFLIRKEDAELLRRGPLPEVFPYDMTNRSLDAPFKPFEDYQIVIRDNPENIESYLEIAQVYSLVGDYLSALKYLKRAGLLDPENIEVQLLTAKNLIWRGAVAEGLKTYRAALLLDPSRLDIWLEAGKVAAWTGRYEESIDFYKNALQEFPDDIDLVANLGLTYLWAGEKQRADDNFFQAQALAADDYDLVAKLAESYNINGVPERSITVLRSNLRRYLERLELYLLLEQIYTRQDRKNKAEEIQELISASFRPSEKLSSYLELFYLRERLREEVIGGYVKELELQPDNLELRQTLAQTYFWNGQRRKAIGELQNVLANHAFIELDQLDQNSARLLELLDRSYLYVDFFSRIPALIKDRKSEIDAAFSEYEDAGKAYEKFQKEVEAARAQDEPPPVPEGKDPDDRLNTAELELAVAIDKAGQLSTQVEAAAAECERDWQILETLSGEEQTAAETFAKLIKPIRWEWNRRDFVEELESVGGVLADYVLNKIYLAEGQLDSAERRLLRQDETVNVPRQYQSALFRTLLWQVKVVEAFKVLETGRFDAFSLVPYWETLEALRDSLAGFEAKSSSVFIKEARSDAQKALEALAQTEKASSEKMEELEHSQEALQRIYRQRLVRSMYRLGENTFLIRNELGDFYLKEQDFPEAIRQYKQVLAIDPWDVETIYDLGTIYEWSGDWKQAMNNFERVYWSDPLYENVTARYNQLAREHADSFELTAYTLIESSRLTMRSTVSYSTWLNTVFGLNFDYTADAVEIDTETYLIHDVDIDIPLYFNRLKLTLTPAIGAHLSDENMGAFFDLGALEAAPHAGLDFGWALGQYLYLNGGLSWGWKTETDLPDTSEFYSEAAELNVSTALSFIKAYPFRYSSMRSYGKVEHVSQGFGFDFAGVDSNWIYSAAQELILGILRVEEPYVELNLLGTYIFETTDDPGQTDYYSPDRVMAANGGISGSAWIPVGEASSFNVGLRAIAGMSWEEGSKDEAGFELEGNLGLSKGDAYYYLRTAYSGPFEYNDGDYRSLYVGLGFSSQLPSLLAP